MDHPTKIAPAPARCHRCGTLATKRSSVRPARPRADAQQESPSCDQACDGFTQITVSPALALRRTLRQYIADADIPQGVFGELILGVDATTICGWLAGDRPSRKRRDQLARIASIQRGEGTVIVAYTCRHNPRWNALLHQRKAGYLPTRQKPVKGVQKSLQSAGFPIGIGK